MRKLRRADVLTASPTGTERESRTYSAIIAAVAIPSAGRTVSATTNQEPLAVCALIFRSGGGGAKSVSSLLTGEEFRTCESPLAMQGISQAT